MLEVMNDVQLVPIFITVDNDSIRRELIYGPEVFTFEKHRVSGIVITGDVEIVHVDFALNQPAVEA